MGEVKGEEEVVKAEEERLEDKGVVKVVVVTVQLGIKEKVKNG